MAGGVGSRFWPISTEETPKQFLDILSVGETLIQQTFRRLQKTCFTENIFIVTNKDYKALCISQLSQLDEKNILCEPVMRNTAPCIAYAAYKIYNLDKDAKLIIAPSDHLILNEDEFVSTVNNVFDLINKKDCLYTLGITPSRPDTGYGYIQYSDEVLLESKSVKKVKTFTEKPNLELALQFIDSGDFLWNAGIFMFSANAIVRSFKKYLSDLNDIFSKGDDYFNTAKEAEFIEKVFPTCKNISIDYGIFEKSNNVYVYPCDFGWSDLGTWGSLYSFLEKDDNQNTIQGDNVNLYDSSSNIIRVESDKQIIIQGLNNFIVVDTKNALLICKKDDEQKIKEFVNDIKKQKL
jgi:mannose-1-phosphate guanylyltransferase